MGVGVSGAGFGGKSSGLGGCETGLEFVVWVLEIVGRIGIQVEGSRVQVPRGRA